MRLSQENENSQRATSDQSSTQSRTQEAECLSFKFPKSARLLTQKHYHRVLKFGTKHFGQAVAMDFRMGKSSCPKLGITVSRRYGKAHLRNRFKRIVREAFRLLSPHFPINLEIHVAPLKNPQRALSFQAVSNDIKQLLARASQNSTTKALSVAQIDRGNTNPQK